MKQLKLEQVRTKHARNTSLRGMVYQMLRAKHTTFDFDVWLPKYNRNLQRGLEWSQEEREECIMSLLKGMGIGTFHFLIIENADFSEVVQVIDGKQRLNALFDFFQNKFPIHVGDEAYYYKEMEYKLQSLVSGFIPVGDLAYSSSERVITDDEKIRWFAFVNTKGKPVDRQHIENLQNLVKP